MLHTRIEKQSILAPIGLGLSALLISGVSASLNLAGGPFITELLLFLAPLAFGLRGALLVIAIAVVPMALNPVSIPTAARLSIVILSLGVTQSYLRAVPPYTIALLAWLAFVPPLIDALQALNPQAPSLMPESFAMLLVQDVLIASLASSFLFNENVWWTLTNRARYHRANQLIPHLMTTTALASVFATGIFLQHSELLDDAFRSTIGMTLGTAIIAAFVLLPTALGLHISRTLRAQESSPLLGQSRLGPDQAVHGPGMNGSTDESWDLVSGMGQKARNDAHALRAAAELDVGVCAVDESGEVLFMNPRFASLAAITEESPVGKPFNALSCASELVSYIWQLVSSTDPSREFSEEFRVAGRPDQVKFLEIDLRAHGSVETGGVETAQQICATPRVIRLSDITARRTIDARLLRIQRHKTLSACASSAAPRLAEIFTSILGRASCALQSGQPAALASALSAIQNLGSAGGGLVQQLNELSVAPDHATRRIVDANASLFERLKLLEGLVRDGIQVSLQSCSEQLPIRVDTALLTQAVSLVVMNAAEAYPDGAGRVAISVGPEEIDDLLCRLHPGSRPGTFARISITDFGRGMSPEVLAKVANPLLTQRSEFGHIGLDLPSVLAVMSEHDGFMTVESKPERGTTVSLFFPLSRGATLSPLEPGDAVAHRPSQDHQNTRVLIVEDRPELRALLQEMVRSLGYRSTACGSRDDALKLMSAAPVDIVLIEDSLPGLAAHQLVSEVHAKDSHAKTVLLAVAANTAAHESDSILVKPFSLQTLAQKLEESEKLSQLH